METIETLQIKKNQLIQLANEKSKKHADLYGQIDISQPKSNAEKESEKEKLQIWNDVNNIVKQIRELRLQTKIA